MAETGKPAKPRKGPGKLVPAKFAAVGGRLKVLLPLAVATLMMVVGFFLVWQTSLVYQESGAVEAADAARSRLVTAIGDQMQEELAKAQALTQSDAVQAALGNGGAAGLAAAAEELKRQWPELVDAVFYAPELAEIRERDLQRFGYSRAQMLMQAQVNRSPAPVQVHHGASKGLNLVLAFPVMAQDAVVAYAYLSLPSSIVVDILRRGGRGAARIDLRQGDGRGDMTVASSHQVSGSSLGDLGVPIPGSELRLAIADVDSKIVVTRNLWLLIPLTLLCLFGGFVALWLRQVGMHGAASALRPGKRNTPQEITLAEALKQQADADARAKPAAGPARPIPPKARPPVLFDGILH